MLIIALALLLLAAVVGAGLLLRRARERSQQHRALFELLPETIVSLFDHDLRFEQVLGATPGIADSRLLIGRTVEDLVPGPEGERLAAEYRRALAGESRAFAFTSTLSGLDYWIRVTPRIERGEVVGGRRDRPERQRPARGRARALRRGPPPPRDARRDERGLRRNRRARASSPSGTGRRS